jgi:hypothetical protein
MKGRGSGKRLSLGNEPQISNRYTAIKMRRKPLKTKGATNF